MPSRLGAAHWRARAQEARALAEFVTDEESKVRMLRIASDYDKLAERAGEQALQQDAENPARQ
jgi:hypothetical protein